MVGQRADVLLGTAPASVAAGRLAEVASQELDESSAHDVAFHMTDWNSDAAFLVAFLLFPERFADDEIREGLQCFLIHAPNHIAAAAKLAGWPIEDIFAVGALNGVPATNQTDA